VEAGVSLAERALGPLEGRPAAVVGAGAMASLAATHLRDRGMGPIRIVNRSVERAARLAERTGAEPARLEALGDVLRGSDLVVSSTGASGTVIRRSAVEEVVPARAGRPLFLLDLAVPRDVDPEAAGIPEVVVADLDDLKAELQGEPGHGEADLAAVRAIVAEEVARFEGWRRAIRFAPLIQALKDRGERAVAAELQRLGPKLAGLTDRQREAVEAVARGVAAKLLHDPIVRLREASVRGDAATRAAAELFDLEIPQPE
jgi:glutamyl-tRNA reductase